MSFFVPCTIPIFDKRARMRSRTLLERVEEGPADEEGPAAELGNGEVLDEERPAVVLDKEGPADVLDEKGFSSALSAALSSPSTLSTCTIS